MIGIPTGPDPAPFMDNLFLYHYENNWIRTFKKSRLNKATQLTNVFRFIDNLTVINDGGEFELSYKEIYPLELELRKHWGEGGSSLKLLFNKFPMAFLIKEMPFLSLSLKCLTFLVTFHLKYFMRHAG